VDSKWAFICYIVIGPFKSILSHFVNSNINLNFTSRDNLDWAAHDWVEFLVFVHDWWQGVVENPEWQGQVDCYVLVNFGWFVQQELDDFDTDCTDDHCSCCGDGWDDLTSNQFNLEVVNFFDLVVSCLKIIKKLLSSLTRRP
jgi:hypothetical protein